MPTTLQTNSKNTFARALSYTALLPTSLRLRLVDLAFALYTPYFKPTIANWLHYTAYPREYFH